MFFPKCKSWLKLAFLRDENREKRGWDKVLATNNKKCDTESWLEFGKFFYEN